MAIENGTYIKINYTGSVNGVPFDTTDAEAAKNGKIFREGYTYGPAIVKVGGKHLLAGFDEDLSNGKEVGVEYQLTIPPEKAFGEHKADEMKAVDKKAFDHKPEMFERVVIEGREGNVVNKVGSRYVVDFNHPLAGQTIEYTYTIESIVEDPAECLAGMIKLLTNREMKIGTKHENFVSIEVPAMMAMYNQNWFMTQYMIMQEALELFPAIESVKFVESFPRPKIPEQPEAVEAEAAEEKTE